MSKSLQIQIPEPCHENWNAMAPQEQGRYCGACQKVVVDFSAMSDKELLQYISHASGSVCGRVANDQLNREIKAIEVKRRFSWAYVWNLLLATFIFTESYAQKKPAIKKKPVVKVKPVKPVIEEPQIMVGAIMIEPKAPTEEELAGPPQEITGVVLDKETNEPLVGASVYVAGTKLGTVTDATGRFNLTLPRTGTNELLTISYVGHDAETVFVNPNKENKDFIVTLKNSKVMLQGSMGGVVVRHRIPKKEKIKRVVSSCTPAILKKDIKVYPNPVERGTSINATVSLKQSGDYIAQLMDLQGRVITQQKVVVTSKEQKITIPTQHEWSAGVYWLRIAVPGAKDVYQAKVSVQ